MVTGLPGHNRGMKWIPGVGYRYPQSETSATPRLCSNCKREILTGETSIVVASRKPLSDPRATETLCSDCANLQQPDPSQGG